ncbi:hypothetical protein [Dysgonomonas massiliensis]|uniref:hypothetical protein n=1 Tax=Dysgonomonas massiliensis TaxID=2040292 RepID=UPI0011AF6D5F|nr:hypothetical protein [Dysgonomonas massiliensis]
MSKVYEINVQGMSDQTRNAYSLDFTKMENMDTYTSLLNVYKEVLKFVDFGGMIKRLSGK